MSYGYTGYPALRQFRKMIENGEIGDIIHVRVCHPAVYAIGSKGSLEWKHERPDVVKHTFKDGKAEILSVGRGFMYDECNAMSRVACAHHEGFIEVFGNIYKCFINDVIARKAGRIYDGPSYPTVEDGLSGQRFIAACVRSNANGNTWEKL